MTGRDQAWKGLACRMIAVGDYSSLTQVAYGRQHAGMFDDLGLSEAEQAVYTALIDTSPAELDSEVVATLEAKGLVARHPGVPARYSAVDPEIALELLILDREERIKRARLAVNQLATRFRANSARHDPAALIEVVTGPDAVRQRVRQIQSNTRKQIRAIDRPPYAMVANTMMDTEEAQLRSGIGYRVIYDPEGLDTEVHQLHGDMELSVSLGEQARVLPHTPVKLFMSDDRYACLPLQAAPGEVTSIVIVHPSGLFTALEALFEALWERALPLALQGGEQEPSQEDRRLLSMLTAGVPDSTAAKHLGYSARTYQRRIQELMARLDAETRFQAGMQAALLGWITRT